MTREKLVKIIDEKEKQLSMAKNESDSWNKGKYNNSSNASVSKILVSSLKKEIRNLQEQLTKLS